MQKPVFTEGQIYHIFNRGVEKRQIFLNGYDYSRFVHNLFEFNDINPAINMNYYFDTEQPMEVEPRYFNRKKRSLLVEILAFSLMPNHFHLLIKERRKNGIVRFMQKLGTGYTMYFNKKYDRVGGLFQGRFKAVLINKESHLIYLPYYIHLNPIELITYGGSTSIDLQKQMDFLENYKWSSFLDYIGEKNFPSITQREFLLGALNITENEYKKETENFIKEYNNNNLDKIKDVIIDND